MRLRFTPTAVGLHRDELHVTRYEGDHDTFVVPLLGFGVDNIESENEARHAWLHGMTNSLGESCNLDAILQENAQLKRTVALQTEEIDG